MHVVRHAMVGGQQVVQRLAGRRVVGRDRSPTSPLAPASMRDELAQLREARVVVVRRVVRDAAHLRVRHRAAERLAVDHLAGGALHEVRPAEPHERRAFDHDDQVGERRQIRAAGDARPHHRGDLRNAQISPHDGIVIEEPARAVLSREDAALVRQVHARRVDEIDDRDAAAHRDLLRAQHLLDRLRPPRSGLDGRVVRDDDDLAAADAADAGDDAGGRRLAVVFVVGDEEADLEKARVGIAQTRRCARGR